MKAADEEEARGELQNGRRLEFGYRVERHLSNVYVKLRLSGKSARAAAAARYSRA